MSNTDQSRATSARRKRAGEIVAEMLGRDYHGFCRLAMSRLSVASWEDAEEAVQSAAAGFIAAYDEEAIADEEGATAAERADAYFRTAVTNQAFKLNRSHSRKPTYPMGSPLGEAHADPRAEAEIQAVMAREDLAAAMGAVGERERLVVALRVLGYEREEIATALGVSDRGLRKIVGKANAQLRALSSEGGEE